MSEAVIVSMLVLAVLTGVGAAAFLVMRSPSFWAEVGTNIFRAMMPKIIEIVSKRMPPEKEAEWRDCLRRGGEWDHIRKRCKKYSK